MDSCEAYEPLLAELLFGELRPEEQERLEAHLAECAGCARTLHEMQETLGTMSERERLAPPPGFWSAFAERLGARLDALDEAARSPAADDDEAARVRRLESRPAGKEEAPATRWLPAGMARAFRGLRQRAERTAARPQALVWLRRGALALFFLVIGLALGRTVFAPPHAAPTVAPAEAQKQAGQAALLSRQARLNLARSKVLLLEMNAFDAATGDPGALRLPDKQRTARSLATEARTLHAALPGRNQEDLRSLLDDLRDVLLRIVALEGASDVEGIELIQDHLDESGLVLRIDLQELRLSSALPASGFTAAAAATAVRPAPGERFAAPAPRVAAWGHGSLAPATFAREQQPFLGEVLLRRSSSLNRAFL